MTYKLYFEFFGKYLTTEIEAGSVEEAKEKVRSRVNFHSKPVENVRKNMNSSIEMEDIKDFLGIM